MHRSFSRTARPGGRRLRLPRLYPITDLKLARARSHAALVRALAREGFPLVQMRDRTLAGRGFYEQARGAASAARRLGVALLINDRVDIALAVGAAGVHLGDGDIPPKEARRILGGNSVIGYSTHSLKDALQAARSGGMDYLAIGPIFETKTKPGSRRPLGPDVIRHIKRRVAMPLAAIGGITPRNVFEVWEAGADGAAVISTLMRGSLSRNAERFRRAQKLFEDGAAAFS
jgi:thiamine-phosphate pyrophosphorylase